MKKICILIISVFCFTNTAYSQSWKELNQKVIECRINGDYPKGIEYAEKAKIQAEKEYGKKHKKYAESLINLAISYYEIGNYTKAEPLYIEALNIRKKVLGENHIDYATSLNDLAVLYYETENYTQAEPLYTETLNIYKKCRGFRKYFYYLTTSANLELLYYKTGNYAKATEAHMKYFREFGMDSTFASAESMDTSRMRKLLNSNISTTPLIMNTGKKMLFNMNRPLMATYSSKGGYSKNENYNNYRSWQNKMEPFIDDQLDQGKKMLGTNHPLYTDVLIGDAFSYLRKDNYEKAEPLLIQANDNLNFQIDKSFGFLSENEKEQFLNHKINYYFEIFNSFFLNRKIQNPSVTAVSYNNELAHKGMLLQSNSALRQSVYSSNDNKLIETYDKYISIHETLSKLYVTPIAERTISIDSLENEAEKLEKELTGWGKDLPGFENLTGLSKIKWQDVQGVLKSDEAAIEFVNFHYYDKRLTDSTFYCVLVLRKDYTLPKMIYLFEEKQLQEYLSTSKATDNANYITKLYSYNSFLTTQYSIQSDKNVIYQLAWQPIDTLLKGITTVYLAPSGLLHKVAFNAIPLTDSTYLLDKYQINIVSSTRILAQIKKQSQVILNNYNTVLYGGIEYDIDSAEMVSLAKQYQKPAHELLTSRSFNLPDSTPGVSWPFLSGTLTEVINIDEIFKSKQINSTLYTGENATEESFKYLASKGKSPEIIHIATHGFFFPEKKITTTEIENVIFRGSISNEPVFTYSENPLFRSGILLAGASRVWEYLPPVAGVEDGTLTAYEVSNINLSNTKLVVLSACETGLGDIKGSEGVYGLQRAFKMAGVQYIIMSLWQVPDYQTSELMKLFYTNFLNGMSIKNAFSTAQQTMKKKYDPFYWAAFVLIE
jgi:CHAT domain-containing protein